MQPDPDAMEKFCHELLPPLLCQGGDVDLGKAREVGADVLRRARAFAALSDRERDVLIMPFVEEVCAYAPAEAPPDLKGCVSVVVRSSLIEELHVCGDVDAAGVRIITEYAVGPLAHLIASARREPVAAPESSPFAEFHVKYPRMWACLEALNETLGVGGRTLCKRVDAPVPELPEANEQVEAERSEKDPAKVVFSGIDPRFDQDLVETMRRAAGQAMVVFVPSMSRFSRNLDKQFRVVEFILAHGSSVLTTNYLLRTADVWARSGPLVRPDSQNPLPGLKEVRGLSGSHRKMAQQIYRQFTG